MFERVTSLLWLAALAFLTYWAVQNGDGSAYLYAVVGVMATIEILEFIWPRWISRVPYKYLPALTGLFAGLWFAWVAWTIITPVIGIALKLFAIGWTAGFIVYSILKAVKERNERRVAVEVTR